jgi:hypothetical protein
MEDEMGPEVEQPDELNIARRNFERANALPRSVEWNATRRRFIPRSSDFCVREAADEYQHEFEKFCSA